MITILVYIAHLSTKMFKCVLQESTNSTIESLRSSATAAHIHLCINPFSPSCSVKFSQLESILFTEQV